MLYCENGSNVASSDCFLRALTFYQLIYIIFFLSTYYIVSITYVSFVYFLLSAYGETYRYWKISATLNKIMRKIST